MKNKAFTLVELMVVIAIIAILAVGSITGYSSYLAKSRDNIKLQGITQVYNSIISESYNNPNLLFNNLTASANLQYQNCSTAGRDCPHEILFDFLEQRNIELPIIENNYKLAFYVDNFYRESFALVYCSESDPEKLIARSPLASAEELATIINCSNDVGNPLSRLEAGIGSGHGGVLPSTPGSPWACKVSGTTDSPVFEDCLILD